MKIRALDPIGQINKGDALEVVNISATALDGSVWTFFRDINPRFEIVKDENQEIIDRVEKARENIDEIPKVYGNKYTLSELKELKELFK